MNEQTHGLAMLIFAILIDTQRISLKECGELREEILLACKDSGLRFVDFPQDPEGCSICKVEEIDV